MASGSKILRLGENSGMLARLGLQLAADSAESVIWKRSCACLIPGV